MAKASNEAMVAIADAMSSVAAVSDAPSKIAERVIAALDRAGFDIVRREAVPFDLPEVIGSDGSMALARLSSRDYGACQFPGCKMLAVDVLGGIGHCEDHADWAVQIADGAEARDDG